MIARLGVLVLTLLVAVLLETVVFARLALAGHTPDLVALTVVGVALADGPESGARYGFSAGIVVDLLAGGLFGVSALVLVPVGYTVGLLRPYLNAPALLVQVVFGGAAGGLVVLGHGVLAFLFDADQVAVPALLQATGITTVYSAALAPVFVRAAARVAARAAPVKVAGSH